MISDEVMQGIYVKQSGNLEAAAKKLIDDGEREWRGGQRAGDSDQYQPN